MSPSSACSDKPDEADTARQQKHKDMYKTPPSSPDRSQDRRF
jgi:hypothetical protein